MTRHEGALALPHSLAAERTVLGILMIAPYEIESAKLLTGEDFYSEANGNIFNLIVHLADAGEPYSMNELIERIHEGPREGNGVLRPSYRGRPTDGDHWELYGGISYIASLSDNIPSTENCDFYVGQVRKFGEARRLMAAATQVINDLGRGYIDPQEGRDRLLDFATMGGTPIGSQSAPIGDVVGAVDEDVDAELAGERNIFMPTGIPDLDLAHDFGGLTTQGMTYVVGASGMGKTSLLNRWALGMAARGEQVYLYGTETGKVRRTRDLKFSLAGIDQRWWASSIAAFHTAMANGRYIKALDIELKEAREKIRRASYFLSRLPIIVNDTGRTVDEVAREIRQYHRQGKCTIAFADYLQDFARSREVPPDTSSQSIHASQVLKETAAKLGIPLIVGAQRAGEQELNSKLAAATDRTIGGLLGSLIPTQIQWTSKARQDAEEVFSLYRRDYYADLYPEIQHLLPGRSGVIEIVARKRRSGALNNWFVKFHGPTKWVGDRDALLDIGNP